MSDLYLKITDIDGESTDQGEPGAIDVLSFSWAVTQSGSAAQGGSSSAGKSSFADFVFVKRLDKATPKLMVACASGEPIKEAVLTATISGEERRTLYEIHFSDIVISSFQQSGSSADASAQEDVGISYATIEVTYKPPDGSAPVTMGWDVVKNKQFSG